MKPLFVRADSIDLVFMPGGRYEDHPNSVPAVVLTLPNETARAILGKILMPRANENRVVANLRHTERNTIELTVYFVIPYPEGIELCLDGDMENFIFDPQPDPLNPIFKTDSWQAASGEAILCGCCGEFTLFDTAVGGFLAAHRRSGQFLITVGVEDFRGMRPAKEWHLHKKDFTNFTREGLKDEIIRILNEADDRTGS